MDKMNRKLTRSASNRMVCGVCAGVGEYFQVDPTVIRLLWAILTFCGVGSCILVYIIAAVIMPEG